MGRRLEWWGARIDAKILVECMDRGAFTSSFGVIVCVVLGETNFNIPTLLMEVPQLPNDMWQVPLIHAARSQVCPLRSDRQSVLDAHDHLSRHVLHEQVMNCFLGRLVHWQLHRRISLRRIP
jgi:hypothetical protein